MSKVSKILISLSFAFIVAFSFMFANLQPLFAKADSIANYNVSFIAPDNSLLYSTGNYIPSGSSLQDIENNNLVPNSCFTELDSNYTSGFKYWSRTRSQSTFSQPSSRVGVNVSSVIKTGGIMYTFDSVSSQQILNQTVTLTFKVSNLVGKVTGWIRNNSSSYTSFGTVSATTDGIYSVTGIVTTLGNGNAVILYFSSDSSTIENNTYTLEWVKFEFSSTFTGYYNSTLVYTLLSAYDFSNYYYQYDIDTSSAITSDKYFYPSKKYVNEDTWYNKVWTGLDSFYGQHIWTDGDLYYYSFGSTQYVLDVSTSTWSQKNWSGLTNFYGAFIWSDGINYYYSRDNEQYILDKFTSTWSIKTWNGLINFSNQYVWTDGTNYYYSRDNNQYVLDVSTSTWSQKNWSGLTNFTGSNVWSDGFNYYYSFGNNQYILDISTSTWSQKTWYGFFDITYLYGYNVWTDGADIYYSMSSRQYVLNVFTSTWKVKIWNGLTRFEGVNNIWTDGKLYYYSYATEQYVLNYQNLDEYNYSLGYNTGYADGSSTGYNNGYNNGYYVGVENAGNYTFFSLISAVIDAPLKTITGLFNFELLGVNLFNLFTGLLTLAVLLFVIKLVLGGK